MLLSVGATLVGEAREEGMVSLNLHLATPETTGRTHYWYWASRNRAIDPQSNAMIRSVIEDVFRNEDKPMLEAQQQRMGTAGLWDLNPVLLAHDAGAVRCRRKLEAICRTEQA
jgi:vanillate O-demethylase monooxygenase subunit